MSKKSVLCAGELLWDLLPTGPALGGAPFNVAYRVGQTGGRGRIATRLGTDELGRRAAAAVREKGLEDDLVQWDAEKPTGTVPVTLDAKGTPDFEIRRDVAYDRLEAAPALLEAASTADAVVYGSLITRTPGARAALGKVLDAAAGALKFCDLNLWKGCWTRETAAECMERADVLKLNEGEAREIGGDAGSGRELAARLAERYGLRAVVVTLGEHGVAARRGAEWVVAPAFEASVVDTCGAGDAFSAGFLGAWLDGLPLAACCRRGNAFGAIVAGQAGATEPFPADWSGRAERMSARGGVPAYWAE